MISRIFAKNVRNLAIQQGRKIGELECACGVSVGYLSKAIKDGHWIPLETAVEFARHVGVGLERLCVDETLWRHHEHKRT